MKINRLKENLNTKQLTLPNIRMRFKVGSDRPPFSGKGIYQLPKERRKVNPVQLELWSSQANERGKS